jgi:iron complex outermembrane receptor protein
MSFRIYRLIAVLIALFPLIVNAQDDEREEEREREKDSLKTPQTEEVVITGTRTYKKIIDIPYSVFRVGDEEIKYARNVNAKDLLADVPGLFLQARYGNDVRISIRGFGTRSNTGIRGIRVLLDGIPESDPDGETSIDNIDYTTLGGVEVVKGNLSSLYTNAPGGVVNFLTAIHFAQSFIRSANEIGEFGLRQNGVKVGIKDKNYNLYSSYTYRSSTGYRQHSSEYRHMVNSVLEIFPNSSSSVGIFANLSNGLQKLPGSLTREEFEQDPAQAYFQAVSSDFKRISQKGRLAVRFRKLFGKNSIHDFEFTGYGAVKDLDFTTNTLYTVRRKYVAGTTARFIEKTPLFGRENEFTAGIDYFYITGPVSSYNNVSGNKGDDLQTQNDETQDNIGIYLQDQVNILKDKMYLLVSGRYDKIAFSNNDMLFGLRNSERKFERFTPKAALNYKLTPNIAVYSSYGLGFDTPSSGELENFPASSNNGFTTLNPDLNPQNSRNFELGIKGSLSNRKSELFRKAFFEVTMFHTAIDDEIIPFVLSDRTYFRNAAQTNRLGVESTIKTELFEEFDITVNYTYTDFKYDTYIARVYNPQGDPVDADYSGNRVPSVPRHLFNFIAEKEFEITDDIEGLFIFDSDFVGGMFVDDQNTESTEDYFYANLLAGINYSIGKAGLILSGGVNNIFDKRYVGFINVNANPEFPQNRRRYYEPGEPRSFYVNLNLSYRL